MTAFEIRTEIKEVKHRLSTTPVDSVAFTELTIALLALYDSYVAVTSLERKA